MAEDQVRTLPPEQSGGNTDPNPFVKRHKEISERWRELLAKPRVVKGQMMADKMEGVFQLRYPDLKKTGLASFSCFFEEVPPGGGSQRHGHLNEAVLYVLEGRGREVHDGQKFPWQAGDLVIVPTGCVHRHINSDPDEPARIIVINPKPVYRFVNLVADRLVDRPGENTEED